MSHVLIKQMVNVVKIINVQHMLLVIYQQKILIHMVILNGIMFEQDMVVIIVLLMDQQMNLHV